MVTATCAFAVCVVVMKSPAAAIAMYVKCLTIFIDLPFFLERRDLKRVFDALLLLHFAFQTFYISEH